MKHACQPIRLSLSALALLFCAPALGQWSTSASLSQPRFDLAAVAVGDQAYFAGGRTTVSGALSDVVDVYDATTAVWSTMTLPTAVGASLAVAVGGRALFTNGSEVDIWDVASASWTSTTLSLPRVALAATSVGHLALFGGGATLSPSAASSRVDIFDASTGQWSTAELSQARPALAATTVGQKALFGGGSDVVDVLDVATMTWTTAQLSEPRSFLAATSVGPRAFFAGGEGFGTSAVVDVYDDLTGTWSTAMLSLPRSDLAATAVGTKALFAYGCDNLVGGTSSRVDIYDDATGSWTSQSIGEGGCSPGALSVGALVLLGGGCADTGLSGGCSATDAVAIYDDAIGSSYCGPGIPNSTGEPATIAAQGFPGSVAQGYALLTAVQLPLQSFGYFLTSRTQGLAVAPGGSQGNLCLDGAIGRYVGPGQIQDSGESGSFELTLDLANHPQPTGAVSVQPGEVWHFQAWYRDATPGPTSNFTDAVSVTFQ